MPTPRTVPTYVRANEIQPGDILPLVSQRPVHSVKQRGTVLRVSFVGTWHVSEYHDGGPGYGWPAVTVKRPAPEES